jgi:hypothetical protein
VSIAERWRNVNKEKKDRGICIWRITVSSWTRTIFKCVACRGPTALRCRLFADHRDIPGQISTRAIISIAERRRENPFAGLSPKCHVCYAALQQTLRRSAGGAGVAAQGDPSRVLEPARVYPAPEVRDRWIVEAPVTTAARRQEPHFFTGPNAQNLALRYAYEEFGSARFFPFPTPNQDVSAG